MARSGAFADSGIIDLINGSFVPLFVDYDRYVFTGDRGWKEDTRGSAELKRIHEAERAAGVPYDQGFRPVHLTFLSPSGEVLESLDILRLLKPEEVRSALQKVAAQAGVEPGEPLFPAACAADFKAAEDDLVLRGVSRFLVRPEEVPGLDPMFQNVGATPPDWHGPPKNMFENRVAAPGTEYVALSRSQWEPLARSPQDAEAREWTVPPEAAAALLCRLRPPCEVYRPDPTRVESATLRARVVEDGEDSRRVLLQGELTLRQPWWDLRDDERVQGRVVGYLTWDKATGRVTSLEVVTDGARYRGGRVRPALDLPVGVALQGPAQ